MGARKSLQIVISARADHGTRTASEMPSATLFIGCLMRRDFHRRAIVHSKCPPETVSSPARTGSITATRGGHTHHEIRGPKSLRKTTAPKTFLFQFRTPECQLCNRSEGQYATPTISGIV